MGIERGDGDLCGKPRPFRGDDKKEGMLDIGIVDRVGRVEGIVEAKGAGIDGIAVGIWSALGLVPKGVENLKSTETGLWIGRLAVEG